MKTVIARFQELKKSPDQIGEIDGEIIDANKIESALRTVGVALRDSAGQFRDLDQVFLELSNKWDSLDTNTQRYIATIAAGSRQQSRFIAMMSNYGRTMELVNAANTAAGTSNEQFEKTMESLESKVNQLTNAWNSFVLGITDSDLIKFVVDLGTKFMNTINSITDVFGAKGGALVKVGLLIGTFKLADKALNVFTKSIKSGNTIMQSFGAVNKSLTEALKQRVALTQASIDANHTDYVAINKSSTAYTEYAAALGLVNSEEGANTLLKKDLSAAQEAYRVEMGLTNAQMVQVEALTAKGLALDQATIMAKYGLTAASYQYLTAEKATITVEQLGNLTTNKRVILTKLLNIQTALATKGIIGQALATKLQAITSILATGATKGLTAAVWSLMWPILAVTSAIGGLVLLFISLYQNSPEQVFKRMEASAKQAKTQANELTESYKSLDEALTSLSEKEKILDNLITGTDEWNDALNDVNGTILKLIEDYSELRDALEIKDGRLTLDASKTANVLESYRLNSIEATNAAAANRISARNTQLNQNLLGSQNVILFTQLDENRQFDRVISDDEAWVREIAIQVAQGVLTSQEDIVHFVTNTYGSNLEVGLLSGSLDQLKKYGQQILDNNKQNAIDNKIILSGILTNIENETQLSQDQANLLTNIYNQDYLEYRQDEALTGIDTKSDAYKKYFTNIYGDSVKVKSGGKIVYKDANGQTKTIDAISAKAQFASSQVTKRATDDSSLLLAAASKLDKFTQDQGFSYIDLVKASGGTALRANEIENLKKYSKQDIDLLYSKLEKAEQEAYGTRSNFEKAFLETQATAPEELQKRYNALKEISDDIGSIPNATLEQLSGIIEKFTEVNQNNIGNAFENNGIDDQLNDILQNQSKNFVATFMSQLLSFDWKDAEAWDGFIQNLLDKGLEFDITALQDFVDKGKEVSDAIKKIDLDKLLEGFQSTQQYIDQLSVKTGDRTIDKSIYDTLVNSNKELAKEFTIGLSGEYIYVGKSIDTLIGALHENTTALLEQGKVQLQTKIDVKSIIDSTDENYAELLGRGSWTDAAYFDYLKKFIANAKAKGTNLGLLGINGLTSESMVEDFSNERIREIIGEIASIYMNNKKYIEQMTTTARDETSLSNQNNRITFNAIQAQMMRSRGNEDEASGFSSALIAQAKALGIDEKEIEQYTKALSDWQEAFKDKDEGGIQEANIALERFETLLTNRSAFEKSNKLLKTHMKEVNDLLQAYDNLTDMRTKINLVQDAVGEFGIAVNEANVDYYAQLAQQYAQGNYNAYLQLLELSAQANNLAVNSYHDLINTQLTEENSEALTKLANLGLGIIQKTEDESGKIIETFIAASKGMILDAADEIGSAIEQWEIPYNWLYNLNKRTNALAAQRNNLEREYNQLMYQSNLTGEQSVKNLQEQANLLEASAHYEQIRGSNAMETIRRAAAANKQFDGLYSIDMATGVLTVDYTSLQNRGYNKEQGEYFEKFIGTLEEALTELSDSNENLWNINDQLHEIQDRLRDSYIELENRVRDALISAREKEIEQLENINDNIKDAQSALVSSLQEQINETRQLRDNSDTEQAIIEKQNRLNYLMRDTSGGNNAQIKALQKELSKDKRSYSDKLVDQAIANLGKANEKAAEQRETQISIQQALLEEFKESGAVWNQVEAIMQQSFIEMKNGTDASLTQMGALLQSSDNIKALSSLQQEKWYTDFGNTSAEAYSYINTNLQKQLSDTYQVVEDIKTGLINDAIGMGQIGYLLESSYIFSLTDADYQSNWNRLFSLLGDSSTVDKYTYGGINVVTGQYEENGEKYAAADAAAQSGANALYDRGTQQWMDRYQKLYREYLETFGKKFATGGLADFTGPAWLDGTQAHPELVLNATDTENFIKLKNILSEILGSGATGDTINSGETNIDVSINVDSLDSDYSVEQLADAVTKYITQKSLEAGNTIVTRDR